ncbi:MAG: TauD/TfdA dioxygenase family protein [Gammaproteobacteria bacterium]
MSATSDRLRFRPLAPFGIELDLDLSEPLDDAERARLRELFFAHGLAVFRRQRLTHPQQVEWMRIFGPVLETPDGVGYISNDEARGGFGKVELTFHSDLAFTPEPFIAISLLAVDVIDGQSATRFASGSGAFARLPAPLRARLSALDVLTAMPTNNATDQVGQPVAPGMPCVVRPAVMTHPVTGASILYLSQMQSVRFEGLPAQESDALMREVLAHMYAREAIYEHRWHRGDLVIWDNLATTHARAEVTGTGPRTLQRVVCARKSFYELCPQFSQDDPEYMKWLNAQDQTRSTLDATLARGARR